MKKLLVAMMCLALAAPLFAEGNTLKIGPSYGLLMSPDVSDAEDYGYDVTKGGIGFSAQLLFGQEQLRFGAEVGYLSIYKLDFSGLAELTQSAIPILGIVQYDLNQEESFKPYLQGGLGLVYSTFKAEILGLSDSESKIGLALALGPGAAIKAGENLDIDVSVKYYYLGATSDYGWEEDKAASTINLGVSAAFKI